VKTSETQRAFKRATHQRNQLSYGKKVSTHPIQTSENYTLSLSLTHTHTHIGVDATQRDELMDEILSEFQGGHDSGRDSSLTVSDFTSSAGLFLFLF
jgi:hypothetical protein